MDKDFQEIHVIPMDDTIAHEECETCDCSPYWDPENEKDFMAGRTSKMVWVHNKVKDNLH